MRVDSRQSVLDSAIEMHQSGIKSALFEAIPDATESALVLRIVREVQRQITSNMVLTVAHLEHIGRYTRYQAREFDTDAQKRIVESVLQTVAGN